MKQEPLPHLAHAAAIEELVTPEGVPVRMGIAGAGERLTAFLFDTFLVFVGTLALVALVALVPSVGGFAVGMVGFFLLRSFYFTWFELRWQGVTPGKRKMQLRVIDARGGQLSVEAVIVRNLTREVETFLPLAVLVAPDLLWPGGPGWSRLLASGWIVIFLLMPLFNRHRRRVGDLIAGTMVVCTPRVALLEDLTAAHAATDMALGQAYQFSVSQLDVYGTHELQVLEQVLRRTDVDEAQRIIAKVSETIQGKIGWTEPVQEHEAFLRAFYAALRAHLERELLWGRERKRKRSDGGSTTTPGKSHEM